MVFWTTNVIDFSSSDNESYFKYWSSYEFPSEGSNHTTGLSNVYRIVSSLFKIKSPLCLISIGGSVYSASAIPAKRFSDVTLKSSLA